MPRQSSIPRISHAFFRWYCKPERYEELHGDLEEFFEERCVTHGSARARWLYSWDVIRCCQSYAWKQRKGQHSNIIMFKNYYKTSWRSMMRNPLSSFINLFGLSAAIGVCILGFGFGRYTMKMDQFHEKKNQVFLTTFFADRDGETQQNGQTPLALGPMMKADLPQVKNVCRLLHHHAVIKYGGKVFHERIQLVDPSFLEMMTFPLKWGERKTLQDANSVILSEDMATKYFGKEYAVGKNITLIFGGGISKTFEVTGVAYEFPGASSFRFDFLVNFQNIQRALPEIPTNSWSQLVNATFIELANPTDIGLIEGHMGKYRELQNQETGDWKIAEFGFVSIAQLFRNGEEIRSDISGNGYSVLYISTISFVIIGFFFLALASANYINIAIISATKRLKEIGLRKVIGANRRMLVIQFLAENILLMTIAMIVGLLLGTTVFIPWLENNSSMDMDFMLFDSMLWLFLPGVLLFAAIISGLYPAIYVSKFQVAMIFKGNFRFGRKNRLTKFFLGFQLFVACVLLSVAVLFTQNTIYQKNRDWGYNQHQVLYAKVDDVAKLRQLGNTMEQHPSVVAISGSAHHVGKSYETVVIERPDREFEVQSLQVDAQYPHVLDLPLKAGRFLRANDKSERFNVLANETFVKKLDLKDPVGESFKVDSVSYRIVGILEDFHSYSFTYQIRPTFFRIPDTSDQRYLTFKSAAGHEKEVHEGLLAAWTTMFPEIPFDGGYQEDVWGGYYVSNQSNANFWVALASLVMLMASLGLYGLVALNVSGRMKEFSIRKVLGARLKHISKIILSKYWLVFLVSLGAGAPVSYYLTELIFDTFFLYRMPMNIHFFAVSGGILLAVLGVVLITQLGKLGKSNPVVGLRNE